MSATKTKQKEIKAETTSFTTKPLPGIHAPCPKCKHQLVSTTVREELVVYCQKCEEIFSLADPKVVLTKKGKA